MYRMGSEELEAVRRVIESRNLFKINGGAQEVLRFEEELKEKIGSAHAICMTSGKAAMISALIGMGIGPGDEVIIPAYTYIASAIAVTATGAIPVIAEVDETLTLDPNDVERKISKYTKAIIPVHIQGFPCDMNRIMEIARRRELLVLEDACQADGGSYHGKRLGTIGDAGAFSFNFFKIITAGEGGALVTDNRGIFERALIYHDSSAIAYFGDQLETVEAEQFCGAEYRVGEFTGAIMREQLKKLDSILHDLHKNRDFLMEKLAGDYRFVPSNDRDGDCATSLAVKFNSEQEAIDFKERAKAAGFDAVRPIETGKHIYTNWTPIMNKKGAYNPAFDPFKMEANKDLNHNYSPYMCPKTLEYLARAVYIGINPDRDSETLEKMAVELCM